MLQYQKELTHFLICVHFKLTIVPCFYNRAEKKFCRDHTNSWGYNKPGLAQNCCHIKDKTASSSITDTEPDKLLAESYFSAGERGCSKLKRKGLTLIQLYYNFKMKKREEDD